MIRGWTSSSSTRQQERAFDGIAAAADEVRAAGRAERAPVTAPDSFYTRPHAVPALASFDGGIAPALRRHLLDQGLPQLAACVDELSSIGETLRKGDARDDTISDLVYEMH